MTRHILISTDQTTSERWSDAFPSAPVFGAISAVPRPLEEGTIVWIHVPPTDQGSIDALAGSVRAFSPARLIVLSDTPSDDQALLMMERGAVGYCHSCAGARMLRQVAAVVGNQGLWVGDSLLRRMIRAYRAALPAAGIDLERLAPLSAREREVALAVSRGASNKEIARELKITERTVKAHLGAIFTKLGVRDRLHLALLLGRVR